MHSLLAFVPYCKPNIFSPVFVLHKGQHALEGRGFRPFPRIKNYLYFGDEQSHVDVQLGEGRAGDTALTVISLPCQQSSINSCPATYRVLLSFLTS